MKIIDKNKKKHLAEIILGMSCLFLVACGGSKGETEQLPIFLGEPLTMEENSQDTSVREADGTAVNDVLSSGAVLGKLSEDGDGSNSIDKRKQKVIQDLGETLETRVLAPYGYERTEAEEESLAEFLRQYPMKSAGAKVHLYDGTEKGNQSAHVAVFDLPIENYDLQQCADSVMRVYAEYYWSKEEYDKIKFHFTNGFLVEYSKWRDGNRVTINGNNVSWIKQKSKDTSYECFVRYLRTIFCYAGTLSMDQYESESTELSNIKAGDVFLYGGSPGHVVMVVDVCENEAGKKAFLLAQGYMPAQEFHLLKNDRHPDDPWYYEEEVTYPFRTPEYTFYEGSLKSLTY